MLSLYKPISNAKDPVIRRQEGDGEKRRKTTPLRTGLHVKDKREAGSVIAGLSKGADKRTRTVTAFATRS